MTTDPHKGLTITYNHLDLPKNFNFGGGKVIDILYDASGNKLRKTVSGTINYTQDYIGGIEYRGTAMEAVYHPEGRVRYISGVPRYEYTIKDHLGNTRLSFSDLNGNGTVEVTSSGATNEILQENHYYPFGLNMEGPWLNDEGLDYRYQYNKKEWNDDYGLNLYPYGARYYDPAFIRFIGVDPIAGNFPFVNTYNYAENEPVAHIDLWGLQKTLPKPDCIGCDGPPPNPFEKKEPIPEPIILKIVKSPILKRSLGVVGFMLSSDGEGKSDTPIHDQDFINQLKPSPNQDEPSKTKEDKRKLYRSMRRGDFFMPRTGEGFGTLGVRPNKDKPVDRFGMVYPLTGGMSVTPDNFLLMDRAILPFGYGGKGKYPLWEIKENLLMPGLKFVQDSPSHGTIQPAFPMPYNEYVGLLEMTMGFWRDLGGDISKP